MNVEVTDMGLFSGKKLLPLTYAQELYEDTLISDLIQLPSFHGNTVQTELPMRTLPSPRGIRPGSIDRKIKALDIPWNYFDLVKSSSNYPALQNHQQHGSK